MKLHFVFGLLLLCLGTCFAITSSGVNSTLQAINDNVTFNANGSGTYNVLSNDHYNGTCSATYQGVATTSYVTVSPGTTSNYYSIDLTTGYIIQTGFSTPQGTYVLSYTICDRIYPLICQTANVTITVPAPFAPTTNPITSKRVQEFNLEETIINPNPTNSTITVYFSSALPNECRLEIYDMFGRKIISTDLGMELTQYDIDLQIFPTGNYIIKLYDDNGNSFYKKIIKI